MLFCLGLLFINPYRILKWIIIGLPILCAISILVDIISNSIIFSAIIARRVLFIPTLLDSLYYDYTNQFGPVFFNSEAVTEMAFNLGDKYFDKEEMRCNNGLFSDAMINLGPVGCIIFPFVFALFFKICNPIFSKINPAISVFSTLLICTTFGSATFTTSIFTHGILFLTVTCYFIACYNVTCYNKDKYLKEFHTSPNRLIS